MMNLYLSKPGIMSCAGKNIDELWQAVTSGDQNGIQKVTSCNGEQFFAGRIPDSLLKPCTARYNMKILRIENAALEQLADTVYKAVKKYGEKKVAVCVGSCDNGTELSVAGHRKFFSEGQFQEDYELEIQGADYVSTFVSEKFGLKGPVNTFSTACSSSAGAFIKAAELIMAGIVDAAVVGGVDIASDTALLGFDSLEAVSSEKTNPFSKNRHGITLADGAAFFVLSRDVLYQEEKVSAVTQNSLRNLKTVRLLGWGESADAYHMTSPDPSGKGAAKAMQQALDMAGLKPGEVNYINLHGTGTKFNDSMEAKAVAEVFGNSNTVAEVPVSSTKAVTGHTLGAAAALELAICWKTLFENYGKNANIALPVQVWDGEQDEELPPLNFVHAQKVIESQKFAQQEKLTQSESSVKICLSNSFAFGGANACLVIGL